MPTVRRLTRQVSVQGITPPRLTSAGEPSNAPELALARGRSSAALAEVGGTLAGIAGDLIRTRRQRADQLRLIAFDRELASWEQQTLYDPQQGLLTTTKGPDVLALNGQVDEAFDAFLGERVERLPERLRGRAQVAIEQRRVQLQRATSTYATRAYTQYEAEETQAALESSVSLAIANADDPVRVSEEVGRLRTIVDAIATQQGLGPEAKAHLLQQAQSAAVTGVIGRLIDTRQQDAAESYFEVSQEQGLITGEDIARIEAALARGTLTEQAQAETDRIMAEAATPTEALRMARALDGDLEDEVVQRVNQRNAEQAASARAQDEALLRQVYDTVDQTQSVEAIPPTVWTRLDGPTRSALRSYANSLASGEHIETDLPTYYRLIQMAGDSPNAFVQENLLRYLTQLDEVNFQELSRLQLSIKNREPEAETRLDDFRTELQVVNQVLEANGVDSTPAPGETDQAAAIARFRQTVAARIRALQTNTGKKATNEDIEQIATTVLGETVSAKEPGFFSKFFGVDWFASDEPRRVIDLTYDDVPRRDRNQIEAALRGAGRPVTEAEVVRLYVLKLQTEQGP